VAGRERGGEADRGGNKDFGSVDLVRGR
jgi:hypothetical protein